MCVCVWEREREREREREFCSDCFPLFNRTRKLRPPSPHLRNHDQVFIPAVIYFSFLFTNPCLTFRQSGKRRWSLAFWVSDKFLLFFVLFSPFSESGTLFLLHFSREKFEREQSSVLSIWEWKKGVNCEINNRVSLLHTHMCVCACTTKRVCVRVRGERERMWVHILKSDVQ